MHIMHIFMLTCLHQHVYSLHYTCMFTFYAFTYLHLYPSKRTYNKGLHTYYVLKYPTLVRFCLYPSLFGLFAFSPESSLACMNYTWPFYNGSHQWHLGGDPGTYCISTGVSDDAVGLRNREGNSALDLWKYRKCTISGLIVFHPVQFLHLSKISKLYELVLINYWWRMKLLNLLNVSSMSPSSRRRLGISCEAISAHKHSCPLSWPRCIAGVSPAPNPEGEIRLNKQQRHQQSPLSAFAAHIWSSWTMKWLERRYPLNQSRSSWEKGIESYQMLLMQLTTAVSLSAPNYLVSDTCRRSQDVFTLPATSLPWYMDAANSAFSIRKIFTYVILKSIDET